MHRSVSLRCERVQLLQILRTVQSICGVNVFHLLQILRTVQSRCGVNAFRLLQILRTVQSRCGVNAFQLLQVLRTVQSRCCVNAFQLLQILRTVQSRYGVNAFQLLQILRTVQSRCGVNAFQLLQILLLCCDDLGAGQTRGVLLQHLLIHLVEAGTPLEPLQQRLAHLLQPYERRMSHSDSHRYRTQLSRYQLWKFT